MKNITTLSLLCALIVSCQTKNEEVSEKQINVEDNHLTLEEIKLFLPEEYKNG